MGQMYIDRDFTLAVMDIVTELVGDNISTEKMKEVLSAMPQEGSLWFEVRKKNLPNNNKPVDNRGNVKTFASVEKAFGFFMPERENWSMIIHVDANNTRYNISYEELMDFFSG